MFRIIWLLHSDRLHILQGTEYGWSSYLPVTCHLPCTNIVWGGAILYTSSHMHHTRSVHSFLFDKQIRLSQNSVYPTWTVHLTLEKVSAKKALFLVPKPAKHQWPVLLSAVLESIVMLPIHVRPVSYEGIYYNKITIIDNSVFCTSSSDCTATLPGTPVCKEVTAGGGRYCQSQDSCAAVCSSAEYCSTAGTCEAG